ncbi:hypothetical protein EB118_12565 [bacterium]|nr:hypothetical protein [bacterium]NDD83059.1 hypothetical protein [bacterium]NDG30892.1 hypothetical protein [bacterium]
MTFYKNYDKSMSSKKEFKLREKKGFLYQDPHQMLLRNFVSKNTVYENVLLYHALGTGKTCTSITIAEGFKEYMTSLGRKVIVLVKNDNIRQNFMNELVSACTMSEYISDQDRQLYYSTDPKLSQDKKELVQRVHKEIDERYMFINYITFVNRVLTKRQSSKPIDNLSNTVIIVDEAHNITNNDIYVALKTVLSRSYNYRVILLTATPIRDNPREIFEISNILNNANQQFPIRGDLTKVDLLRKLDTEYTQLFKGVLYDITPEAETMLLSYLNGKVSYLQGDNMNFPTQKVMGTQLIPGRKGSENVYLCEMSDFQFSVYKNAIQLDTHGDTGSAVYKNSADASTMVYKDGLYGKAGFTGLFNKVPSLKGSYNTTSPEVITSELEKYSTKLYNLVKNIKSSPGNVFVYSNYVTHGGTTLIKQVLLANGFKSYNSMQSNASDQTFVVLDENLRPEVRERLRRIFNSPKNARGEMIKIIVGSPIVAEGITFKNVRQVHILEPTWNMSRINQIIGRAVRNHSHRDLSRAERTVDIYKYVAIKSGENVPFIDKEMYILMEEKDRANKKVERLLKQVSFDCRSGPISGGVHGSPRCDYTHCELECVITADNDQDIDTSTYNYYIRNFEQYDYEYTTKKIKDLYKKYFVWSLDDIINYIKGGEPDIDTAVIYTALGDLTKNKATLVDQYGREGYVIHRGQYYIFNPTDIDVESSVYSRMFDFLFTYNTLTFDAFAESQLGVTPQDTRTTEVKQKSEQVQLSKEDTKYNDTIISTMDIFGTYVSRENVFDGKFRIVQKKSNKILDKRKIISGMAISSFKKEQLTKLVDALGIPIDNVDNTDKRFLEAVIEKYLLDNNRVLKPHSAQSS